MLDDFFTPLCFVGLGAFDELRVLAFELRHLRCVCGVHRCCGRLEPCNSRLEFIHLRCVLLLEQLQLLLGLGLGRCNCLLALIATRRVLLFPCIELLLQLCDLVLVLLAAPAWSQAPGDKLCANCKTSGVVDVEVFGDEIFEVRSDDEEGDHDL